MSSLSSSNGTTPQAEDEKLEMTFEQAKQEELDSQRARINEMEAALARAPVTLRRMTRAQCRQLGIWF